MTSDDTAYRRVLEELFALRRFGIDLGLERVTRALDALGRPERAYRVIHVTGTNGKGSTAAFAAALCRAAGLRTGLYTSPHLSRFTERIQVDGREIDRDDVVGLSQRVAELDPGLTFFERVTVMALLHFREQAVDVAVLEVGLGGRLDATNVVEAPAAAVVTGVALDHQEILGPTLGDIAREKAGIFKAGCPAILAADDVAARDLLLAEAGRLGARPVLALGRDLPPLPDDTVLGLAGPHQHANAALAVAATRFVTGEMEASRRDAALAAVRWPGRLELVSRDPDVLVDAAHNPDGARALARSLAGGAPVVLVLAVAADKDVRGILEGLAPVASAVIATEARTPRALDPGALAGLARDLLPAGVPVEVEPSIPRALEAAARLAAAVRARVVACGSLFLVGPVREHYLGERPDPVWVADPNLRPISGRA